MYCITSREQISEESFKSLPFLPLKDTVLLWEVVSAVLSRGKRPDPVVPSPLTSLLRAVPAPLGEKNHITRFPQREICKSLKSNTHMLGSNLRNSYSGPTTLHSGQEFSLLFPWKLGKSECASIPMRSKDLPLSHLKQSKTQAHSTYLSSLHSHHFPPRQAWFSIIPFSSLFNKHTIFRSDIKPLLGLLLSLPTMMVCTWNDSHFSCSLLKSIWLVSLGIADWIRMDD